MEVTNPRRIMVLGTPDSGTLALLENLTGSAPEAIDNSTAGLSHAWSVKTSYYKAEIPIWLDEVADTEAWKTEFLKPEAREVIIALGAWVYCFRRPLSEDDVTNIKAALAAIQAVIEKACGYGFDGVCLAVAMPQSKTPYLEKSFDDWEDICKDYGFEYIDFEAKGRNEYGEPVGTARVKEALEANEWEGDEMGQDDIDDFDEDDNTDWERTFAAEEAEMNFELFGMKDAVRKDQDGEGDENDVEELERMLTKLRAVKGISP